MAESAVRFLLQTLGSLAQQEASLLQELSGIDVIQQELQSMRSFLKDADRRRNSNDQVKIWVGQVREAAYKVEDIIEEYMYHIAKGDRGGGLMRRVLYKTILLPKSCFYKHKIAFKLRKAKYEIHSIFQRSQRFGFQIEEGSTSKTKDDGENWQRSGAYLSFISDDDIVGIEKSKEFLIRRLTDGKPEHVVLSVLGMGGLGKTTLVSKAYNSPEVKNHFDCKAWITVSQSYKIDELMRSIITDLDKSDKEASPHDISRMNTGDLVETIHDYLKDKRYVIVLDDVWEPTVWKDIQVAFPNNTYGGRVVITTRIESVSSSFGEENVLCLEPLCHEDALVLFCKKAFSNESCPPELEPYAESLVRKCEGLPLAIVAIGVLMLTKGKSTSEWKKVEDNLRSQLSSNKELERMKNILLLSYNDLQYNLKHCFLYCSLFPEDYPIPQKRLSRLWVAEGFIEESKGLTLEEVASDYIKELIRRSMLLVVEDDTKMRKMVRMHDVLRELALAIAREEKFCDVYASKEDNYNNEARRLSLCNCIGSFQSSTCHLRSLMLFSTEIPSLSLSSIASSIKPLRVLDLQGSSIDSLPDELLELFNLRYLSLRDTNVEKLPKSIGRFRNLQTLDIRDSKIKILPKGVEKLKKLRHLLTYRYQYSVGFPFLGFAQAPTGICNLKCLQTLQCIQANNEIVGKVGNLTQLRKLSILDVKSFHGEKLCDSLQKLGSLLILQVSSTGEEEILHLDTLLSPPIHLENLKLSGPLEKLPSWIRSLQELTKVYLRWSQLNEDPFTLLQALPNLVRIDLDYAYLGKELCIRRRRFLKLKALVFCRLPQLDRILIEEESMSCIEIIYLFHCPELKTIPEGIQYLTSLQELALMDMSGELLRRIRQDRSVNLKHIRQINHYDTTPRSFQRL